MWHNEIFKCVGDAWGGGWRLWISIDGDDHRVFFGFKISGLGIFLHGKIWQVFLWVTCLS